MGVPREFESLLAEFVGGLMVPFAVGIGSSGMRVRGQVMKFRRPIVRGLGHDVLLPGSMQTSGARIIGARGKALHKP